ncbi:MAG: phosphopentomutase [Bacteroidota bacterium]
MFVTIVLDGVGIGAQPDAERYGDAGSHTLGHVCAEARPDLPNLAQLGLGCIAPLSGVPPADQPLASFGRMTEVSAGKDSTTGHWELSGLHLAEPFPTYPGGFPPDLVARFLEATGCAGVLANKPASGTAVIDAFGEAHRRTGHPVLYTSADSVFQVAAHKDVLPLEQLYALCRTARTEVCVGEHAVGRVIARPFVGEAGAWERVSAERKDFSLAPSGLTVQEALQGNGVRTVAVGKIGDLFGDVGFDEVVETENNSEGVARTLDAIRSGTARTFVWTNLVDFDQHYGHRNDPAGFARALEAFDRALPALMDALPDAARLVLTADHGNDPCFPGTDHTREYVPLLLWERGRGSRDLGLRATFADHAASVAAHFGAAFTCAGQSFV